MTDGSDWRSQAPQPQPPYWETPRPAAPPAWTQPVWATPTPYPVAPRRRLRTFLIVSAAVLVVAAGSTVEGIHHQPHGVAAGPSRFAITPPIPAIPLGSVSASQPAVPASPAPVASTPAVPASGQGVTARSVLTGQEGTQVFSDDFEDPGSGWVTGSIAHASNRYQDNHYVVALTGPYHLIDLAPYDEPLVQLSETVTATVDDGAPSAGGFGLACIGAGTATTSYEFVLNGTSTWYVERADGSPANPSVAVLRRGTSPATPGPASVTATAVCAAMPDGSTIRLALFVNGKKVVDLLQPIAAAGTASTPGIDDFLGAMLTAGGPGGATTVRASLFSENDLGPGNSSDAGPGTSGFADPEGGGSQT